MLLQPSERFIYKNCLKYPDEENPHWQHTAFCWSSHNIFFSLLCSLQTSSIFTSSHVSDDPGFCPSANESASCFRPNLTTGKSFDDFLWQTWQFMRLFCFHKFCRHFAQKLWLQFRDTTSMKVSEQTGQFRLRHVSKQPLSHPFPQICDWWSSLFPKADRLKYLTIKWLIHNIHKRQTLQRYLCSLELQIKASEYLFQAYIPQCKAKSGSLVNEPSLISKLTVDDQQTWWGHTAL